MIEFQNLDKTFGEKQVLKNVSGVLEDGKVNMIIGASGTGKSVLLKCLVGLVKPDAGKILYDGRTFTNATVDQKLEIRREIGMLFQGGALFDSMTVEENVTFPLNMLSHKMSKEEKRERVHTVLTRVGLDHAAKLKPSEISGGMAKRVGIA